MPLERFSAAWREQYVQEATANERNHGAAACVFCELQRDGVSASSGVFAESEYAFGVLNAFPYGSGHALVLPKRHVADLDDLGHDEAMDFFTLLRATVRHARAAYAPDGFNVGFNLGRAAGAGIPQHLHGHVLPRWNGDTNFMTSLGETRVLPESLASSWAKLHAQFDA